MYALCTLHTGKDEQLGKSIYNGLEIASGQFVVIYEWVLQWQKKMGKFLTNQEREQVDKCKKQVRGGWVSLPLYLAFSHVFMQVWCTVSLLDYRFSVLFLLLLLIFFFFVLLASRYRNRV